jgi:hypothetical protein
MGFVSGVAEFLWLWFLLFLHYASVPSQGKARMGLLVGYEEEHADFSDGAFNGFHSLPLSYR